MTEEFDDDGIALHAAIDAAIAKKSPAEIDRERRYQEEQRQRLTVMDGRSAHAMRAIEIATNNLLTNPDDDFEYTRMAEGYFLLGDFAKAAELTRNTDKKAEYEAYANAKPVQCVCPAIRQGNVTLAPRFIKEKFPDKDIIYCTTCHQYFYAQKAR